MKKVVLVLSIAFTITSCKEAINKTISKENYQSDVKEIEKKLGNDYTKEDFAEMKENASNKLTANLLGINKKDLPTYKEVLDSAKQQRLRDEAAVAEYRKATEILNKQILVVVDAVKMIKGPYDIGDYINLAYTVTNTSGKNISAFDGRIAIIDILDNELAGCNAQSTISIITGASKKFDNNYAAYENITQLQETPKEKLKFVFTAQTIVFEDGTKLIAPAKPFALTKLIK